MHPLTLAGEDKVHATSQFPDWPCSSAIQTGYHQEDAAPPKPLAICSPNVLLPKGSIAFPLPLMQDMPWEYSQICPTACILQSANAQATEKELWIFLPGCPSEPRFFYQADFPLWSLCKGKLTTGICHESRSNNCRCSL